MASDHLDLSGRRIVLFNWRDTKNPEGGGAELYLERMAEGLVANGADVTHVSARYPGAPREEWREGVRYIHRGSKLSIYLQSMADLVRRRFGRIDAIVDVENGLPFFTRLATRKPVIVLVPHVHREQWPVVYPGLMGRVGWLVERRIAPWLYRHCQYVAVSQATRQELQELGVRGPRIAVVHNGTEPTPDAGVPKTAYPSMCVVGRLVPHKQVEHAIDAVAHLREQSGGQLADLRLTVVGDGWWAAQLRDYAQDRGVADAVEFTGHVDEATKTEIYARSWVMALPSLKEGWGLVIGEAAMQGTPTVAYASAGGTRESIRDTVSGMLVEDQPGFESALAQLLTDDHRRAELAAGARWVSGQFTWAHSQTAFTHVVNAAIHGRQLDAQDPE